MVNYLNYAVNYNTNANIAKSREPLEFMKHNENIYAQSKLRNIAHITNTNFLIPLSIEIAWGRACTPHLLARVGPFTSTNTLHSQSVRERDACEREDAGRGNARGGKCRNRRDAESEHQGVSESERACEMTAICFGFGLAASIHLPQPLPCPASTGLSQCRHPLRPRVSEWE